MFLLLDGESRMKMPSLYVEIITTSMIIDDWTIDTTSNFWNDKFLKIFKLHIDLNYKKFTILSKQKLNIETLQYSEGLDSYLIWKQYRYLFVDNLIRLIMTVESSLLVSFEVNHVNDKIIIVIRISSSFYSLHIWS